MKEFTIIVRNRNTGNLKCVDVKADNQKNAVTNCMRELAGKGNFEHMYHREKQVVQNDNKKKKK